MKWGFALEAPAHLPPPPPLPTTTPPPLQACKHTTCWSLRLLNLGTQPQRHPSLSLCNLQAVVQHQVCSVCMHRPHMQSDCLGLAHFSCCEKQDRLHESTPLLISAMHPRLCVGSESGMTDGVCGVHPDCCVCLPQDRTVCFGFAPVYSKNLHPRRCQPSTILWKLPAAYTLKCGVQQLPQSPGGQEVSYHVPCV